MAGNGLNLALDVETPVSRFSLYPVIGAKVYYRLFGTGNPFCTFINRPGRANFPPQEKVCPQHRK